MGIPVQLHIITGRVPDPIHFYTPEEQALSPQTQLAMFYEVMGVLVNEFIFGRILDRHPALRLVCSEFEISWIPHFMWRLDHMQDAMSHRLVLPKLDMRASDYMRQRIWHGMIDDIYGTETIEYLGADRILWGSDFPHNPLDRPGGARPRRQGLRVLQRLGPGAADRRQRRPRLQSRLIGFASPGGRL